jgi:hypothetical protein
MYSGLHVMTLRPWAASIAYSASTSAQSSLLQVTKQEITLMLSRKEIHTESNHTTRRCQSLGVPLSTGFLYPKPDREAASAYGCSPKFTVGCLDMFDPV